MLIRCIRRYRGIVDTKDADAVYDAEFTDRLGRPELELSVYSVDEAEWLAAYICHHAAGGSDPPRFARAFDVSPIRNDSVPDPVDPCAFGILTSHQILRFTDESALRTFVAQLVAAIVSDQVRVFDATTAELKSWLRSRKRAGDTEWATFLRGRAKWEKWSGADSVPPPAA